MDRLIRLADYGLYGALALGIIWSVGLIVAGLLVFPQNLSGGSHTAAVVMLWVLIPAWVGFVLLRQYKVRDLTPRQAKHLEAEVCPGWMRRIAFACTAFGVFFFFLPIVAAALGYGPASHDSKFPSTLLGGFGLIVNSMFFRQLYAINARRELL